MPVCSRRLHDVSIYAQALLDRLAGRPSEFPLEQATLELMTTSAAARDYSSATPSSERCHREKPSQDTDTTDPLLAPHYPAIKGQNLPRLWLGYRYGQFPAARHGSFPSVALGTQALPEPRCG